ncbi:hypothetical protein [Nitrospirillum amazonense]|uniref:Serine/threonine protein phosphatase 1 n=1 Tax=Nitrospirillum amazonense TaxID=28077 RepID=A0A560JPZ9_9PROT|nr:hypothetical protein [Nitrospirillum amazonense]MDG3442291.1 hypothetical protein [Nitrospirillum amazonense]TWB73213.1 hypothetical protein FBZ87_105133 [Nitrospirillum amazonense]
MNEQERFVVLGRPRRIWAVGAIHGDVDRLAALHDDIGARFQPGDRLIYLGNLIGRGPRVRDTMDELLSFRRAVLSVRGVIVSDLVYLRGGQEEMWQKLLQLQFAPNPAEVLQWMMTQGVDATLAAYGGSAYQGVAAARDGAVSLARWTGQLRAAQRAAPGHDTLFAALRRAAYTERRQERLPELLFVNAGIDTSRPLAAQGDSFWWGGGAWSRIDGPYAGFGRVVRGYDPGHGGLAATPATVTLDGGCGFSGTLACGCFGPDGELLEVVEV